MLFGYCPPILFVSSTNYFQIVWRLTHFEEAGCTDRLNKETTHGLRFSSLLLSNIKPDQLHHPVEFQIDTSTKFIVPWRFDWEINGRSCVFLRLSALICDLIRSCLTLVLAMIVLSVPVRDFHILHRKKANSVHYQHWTLHRALILRDTTFYNRAFLPFKLSP